MRFKTSTKQEPRKLEYDSFRVLSSSLPLPMPVFGKNDLIFSQPISQRRWISYRINKPLFYKGYLFTNLPRSLHLRIEGQAVLTSQISGLCGK
jgi:hypothetical protein